MQPLLRVALVLAALAALTRAAERGPPPVRRVSPIASAGATPSVALRALCAPGTLPDDGVCIPVPLGPSDGQPLEASQNAHREKSGRWRFYDQIPRRPERPSDYRRYRYPVEPLPGQNLVSAGYDLDRADSDQRRGDDLSAVGHGGIDLAQKRGTEVRLVALEHQEGDADVVFVGPLFGNTVVTRHSLREGGALRDYLVLYGHLDGTAPGLAPGSAVREGSLLGFVGDSGSPGDVHVHVEVRRVRDGVDARQLAAGEITRSDKTVVCDPRNVLPLNQ